MSPQNSFPLGLSLPGRGYNREEPTVAGPLKKRAQKSRWTGGLPEGRPSAWPSGPRGAGHGQCPGAGPSGRGCLSRLPASPSAQAIFAPAWVSEFSLSSAPGPLITFTRWCSFDPLVPKEASVIPPPCDRLSDNLVPGLRSQRPDAPSFSPVRMSLFRSNASQRPAPKGTWSPPAPHTHSSDHHLVLTSSHMLSIYLGWGRESLL